MIQGSAIAPYVAGIFGCEFIENPLPPGFSNQNDFGLEEVREISQIGTVVDHTTKTRKEISTTETQRHRKDGPRAGRPGADSCRSSGAMPDKLKVGATRCAPTARSCFRS